MEPDLLESRVRDAYQQFEFDTPVEAIERRGAGHREPRRVLRLATATCALILMAAVSVAMVRNAPEAMATIEFPDGTTIEIAAMFDPAIFDELRERFAEYGAVLIVDELPVAQAAVGRVLGVQYPPDALTSEHDRYFTVDGPLSEPVRITVGVESTQPNETAGLTVQEVFPELRWAVDVCDPLATKSRLETLGFTVDWSFIEFTAPGVAPHTVAHYEWIDSPEADDVIISVLRGADDWHDDPEFGRGPVWDGPSIDPDHRSLIIEVVDDIDSVSIQSVSCP